MLDVANAVQIPEVNRTQSEIKQFVWSADVD